MSNPKPLLSEEVFAGEKDVCPECQSIYVVSIGHICPLKEIYTIVYTGKDQRQSSVVFSNAVLAKQFIRNFGYRKLLTSKKCFVDQFAAPSINHKIYGVDLSFDSISEEGCAWVATDDDTLDHPMQTKINLNYTFFVWALTSNDAKRIARQQYDEQYPKKKSKGFAEEK